MGTERLKVTGPRAWIAFLAVALLLIPVLVVMALEALVAGLDKAACWYMDRAVEPLGLKILGREERTWDA